ncbi:MFS transporter [Bifidobacterium leontopitheci]|uniref:Oligogalacturonide transporter n=1 Tax=Bifidobacterium leontopitheci TaxID=2650774 RepID=A0A6I1GEV9_9BIFI|nr:MFS transporter [Bifidobacterium leontopitheci]KAB7790163.1 oligogalacturonide transporter [Bifidobacterium leontopitheci]
MSRSLPQGSDKTLVRPLSWKAKLGYSTFSLSYVMQTMIVTWQMFYFTTFLGVPMSVTAVIIAVGKIVASVIGPVWGYISDRMYRNALGRRFGRRRSILLFAIPANFVFYLLLWIPNLSIPVYFLANLLYWAFFAGITTVQYGLPSEMTENPGQRAQLVGVNQIAGAIGGTFLSVLNVYLFTIWGKDNWESYFNMALLYGLIGTAVLMLGFLSIQERPFDESTNVSDADAGGGAGAAGAGSADAGAAGGSAAGAGRIGFGRRLVSVVWNFLSVLKVKEFRNYLGLYLSEECFRTVRGTLNTYFVIFVLLLDPQTVSLATGINLTFGIACVAFFIWLTARVGGPRAYRIGGVEVICVFLAMFALAMTAGSLPAATRAVLYIGLGLFMNFGITGVVNATQYTYTFIPDVDEIITSKRREGQYAAINSTIDDIFSSAETIVIGLVLEATGFMEGAQTQPPQTVFALACLFSFVPIMICLVGIAFTYRLRLNRENHELLLAEIARLRAGGSMADVTPETRAMVESLTGMPYERCWGHNNVINVARKG